MIKKILIIFCIIMLLLMGLFTSKRSENQKVYSKENPYIRTADNVTTDMLNPKFWIKVQADKSQVIMTEDEIENWNEKYREKLRSSGAFFQNALEKEVENVQYGFTVNRASIREMPTKEQVYEDAENKYFCKLQVSSILMNEPVIIHQEDALGQWYYITCRYCSGWVLKENVGVVSDYKQWKNLLEYDEFLLVTGNKEILDVSEEYLASSELILYMGTKLELVKYKDFQTENNNRVPYECYIVKIPVRNEEGKLEYEYGFVPVSRDVHVGYLPYTKENLISCMFKINGDRYGWGGMHNSRDCSQYVMEIYSLFGFEFPRNSAAQAEMDLENIDIKNMDNNEKEKILNDTLIGSLLYFEGHIMLYLGEIDGEYFVISQTARIMEEENVVNAHSCMITPLSVKRPSGKMWLEELERIIIVR